MAVLNEFFTGEGDVDLETDSVGESGILCIQKVQAECNAVYTSAGTTFALTGTTISADDLYNSAGTNLELIDDDGVVCYGTISETVSSGAVITCATIKKYSTDGAATLTNSTSYSIRILSPTIAADYAAGIYGKYLGWVKGIQETPTIEQSMYKIGIPRETKMTLTLENSYVVGGTIVHTTNADILKAIFGYATYGTQPSGGFNLAWGSDNGTLGKYRLHLIFTDLGGHVNHKQYLRGTMKANGVIDFTAEEHKSIPFTFDGLADSFYPEGSRLIRHTKKAL